MSALPSGTVTFMFTDIEGSTRLVQALGDEYPALLAAHQRLIADAVTAEGGRLFGSEGDALFAVFESALAAVRAAASAQRALSAHRWPAGVELRVRMGVHSGEATVVADNYVGLALHQVARLTNAGHGGQVLVSESTRQLVADQAGSPLELRDAGEHRLRDLAEPVRIYQLVAAGLADDFPPLRTLSSRPNNLPVQLTSFVARDELADALQALRSTRLLTLSGPGGTGKTRLALQLAAEALEDFPDGIWFVALEAVTDVDLVPSVIASTVGLSETSQRTPLEALAEHLRDRKVLLVLDNFEQVVDAAPTIGQLLRAAPELKVIVTSRIVLRIHGEHEFAVPPLALPASGPNRRLDAASASLSGAVRLFADRARAVQPSFELNDANAPIVAEIVSQLDGLPLAIELAAARTRILPIEAIRARLDQRLSLLTGGARDLPARQQTLRGAIDWSYEMLDAPERALFERFSVFAGGGFLAQVDEVCGPAGELGMDVLDGLSALADKSLLRAIVAGAEEPRFAMLANLREYAAERLAASGTSEATRLRHAQVYLDMVESCADLLTQEGGGAWQDRLELDHDNLRATLDWAVEKDDAGAALRMIAGMWRFWQARGHLHEARRRTDQVLAMPGVDGQPARVRARGYGAGGSIRYWQGDFVGANGYYAKALEAARESGVKAELALALYNYGFAPTDALFATQDERYAHSTPYFEQALGLYEEMSDERGVAGAEWGLAMAAAAVGDIDRATLHNARALDTYRRLGDPFGVGWSAHMLSLYALSQDRIDEASELGAEALATFRASGDVGGIVLAAYDLGLVAVRLGRADRSLRIAGAVDALSRASGLGVIGAGFEFLNWRAPTRPTDPAELEHWEEGARWTVEQLADYAGEGLRDTATPRV